MEAEKQSSVWKNLMPFCGVPQPQSKEEGAAAAAKFLETQLKTIADAASQRKSRMSSSSGEPLVRKGVQFSSSSAPAVVADEEEEVGMEEEAEEEVGIGDCLQLCFHKNCSCSSSPLFFRLSPGGGGAEGHQIFPHARLFLRLRFFLFFDFQCFFGVCQCHFSQHHMVVCFIHCNLRYFNESVAAVVFHKNHCSSLF